MDDLVTQLATDYGMTEDEVRAKVGDLIARCGGGDRSSLLDQISERLGGPAATGRSMGDLEGRMQFDAPEGGVIGGLGSMLGQARGNEEPHTTFQDVADELAKPANGIDIDREDARETAQAKANGFREIDERDLTRGDDNPTDNFADLNAMTEDDIINGLDSADRHGTEAAVDRS